MQPRKLNLCFCFFPYGGNGGIRSEVPDIRNWVIDTVLSSKGDPRIGNIQRLDLADTPITMTRNAAVKAAQDSGADVLIMVDSDMKPDCELGEDPNAKPWFKSSFDFLYDHYERGPVSICAPYCGPPPHENVYVFKDASRRTNNPNHDYKLEMYSREEAEHLAGIAPVAAQPTGLIMQDIRIYKGVPQPYYDYEYDGDGPVCDACGLREPGPQARKASTEDVVSTRNLRFHWQLKGNYNPLFCNWDAWAGHWKPLCVRKPRTPKFDHVERGYRNAVLRGHKTGEAIVELGAGEHRDEPSDEEMARQSFRHQPLHVYEPDREVDALAELIQSTVITT